MEKTNKGWIEALQSAGAVASIAKCIPERKRNRITSIANLGRDIAINDGTVGARTQFD